MNTVVWLVTTAIATISWFANRKIARSSQKDVWVMWSEFCLQECFYWQEVGESELADR
jgi:hypothetical protein